MSHMKPALPVWGQRNRNVYTAITAPPSPSLSLAFSQQLGGQGDLAFQKKCPSESVGPPYKTQPHLLIKLLVEERDRDLSDFQTDKDPEHGATVSLHTQAPCWSQGALSFAS